jgi:hypothetical protein
MSEQPPEPQAEGPAVVAQGAISTLRELRELLGRRGIRAEMIQPPEGQGSS